MIFEGFFAGRMPGYAIFSEVNPFLKNGGAASINRVLTNGLTCLDNDFHIGQL